MKPTVLMVGEMTRMGEILTWARGRLDHLESSLLADKDSQVSKRRHL